MSYAIGVCGFGRCGSSMVMQMLAAGGVPILGDADPVSGELSDVSMAWDLDLAGGGAVKLLDAVLHFGLPPAPAWRFVWLDRDPVEQARSHVKFARGLVPGLIDPHETDVELVERFAQSYRRDRPRAIGMLHAASSTVLKLRYEHVLAYPLAAARQLRAKVWPDLDVDDAAAVVHDRDPACLPDLALELGEGRRVLGGTT